MQSGPQTLPDLGRALHLPPSLLKPCLLVLLNHNCLQPFRPEDNESSRGVWGLRTRTVYVILPENILQRLRFPKFLLHTNETLGAEVRGTSAASSRRTVVSAGLILPPLFPRCAGGEGAGGAVGARAPHTSSDDGASSCQGRRRSVFICLYTHMRACMRTHVHVFRTHVSHIVSWMSYIAYICTDHVRNVMMKECEGAMI